MITLINTMSNSSQKTMTIEYTFDELHAFSEHVTWDIYEQDQPVNDDLQSFIDKTLYDHTLTHKGSMDDISNNIDYDECVDYLVNTMRDSND